MKLLFPRGPLWVASKQKNTKGVIGGKQHKSTVAEMLNHCHCVKFRCYLNAFKAKKTKNACLFISKVIYECTLLKYLIIFQALWRPPSTSITLSCGPWCVSIYFKNNTFLVCVCFVRLGGHNNMSRVKRRRLNKNLWETLPQKPYIWT